MTEEQPKLQQMGILDILKMTIKLYRDNFALFLEIVAILFAPIVILSGLRQVQFAQFPLLLNFLILIAGAVAAGALTIAICRSYLGEQLTLKQVFKQVKQFGLFSILGAAFLISLLVVGFELVRIGLLKIGIIGVISLVPIVPLFLWMLVNWSLYVQSIVIEKRTVIDSFRRSRELFASRSGSRSNRAESDDSVLRVRQSWWRVLSLLLLLTLSVLVPMWIAGAIGGGITNIPMAGLAFSVLSIVFTAPVYIIGTTLLYFDLRIRKEDFNTETLAQNLKIVEAPVRGLAIDENYARKRNALYIVLGANLFLIALKFFLAAISNSVAIAASGWMSVENFFLTSAVLFGVLVSVRDERFSKRLSLIENVLAVIISIAILYIAGNMFVKMFIKMAHGMKSMAGHGMPTDGLMYIPPVTIAAIFGALICYFMSQYKIYIGISCESTSIEAAGRHCRLHVFMEAAVIIGLIGAWIGLAKLNLLAAAFVLAYVIYTGITILWRGYKGLTAGYPMEHACHIERNYKLIGGFIAAMLALYFATGIYIIEWNENGVVKRFGREVSGAVQPGLRYHLPWPIEMVEKVKMDEVRELGTEPILLVAGDENIVKIKIGVDYNVKDAADYIFNTQEPHKLTTYNAEAAIRDIIGRRKIIGEEDNLSYLLTNGKSEVEEVATKLLQELLDKDKSGINVLSMQILALDPPDEVAEAFRDIASAMEEKQTYIHEAEEYRNQIVTEAKGRAAAMVNLAQGYKAKKINNARGEAEAYLKKLSEYQKAREITDIRLYLETMEKILPGVKKVFVDGDIKKETTDLWLINDKVKGKVVGFE
ncbi:TPA: FtsH protease activity modulator HflK [Candidatus Poribacteria bacterium]|nr:FtsH protease activity modulator HflK [Candidatus Poribacteria bacterium]